MLVYRSEAVCECCGEGDAVRRLMRNQLFDQAIEEAEIC
jgi:hypothetical protein